MKVNELKSNGKHFIFYLSARYLRTTPWVGSYCYSKLQIGKQADGGSVFPKVASLVRSHTGLKARAFCLLTLWNCFGKGHCSLYLHTSGLSVVLIFLDHTVIPSTASHTHSPESSVSSLAFEVSPSPDCLACRVLPFCLFCLCLCHQDWGSSVSFFWSFTAHLIVWPSPLSWPKVNRRSISLINPWPWALTLCMCWLRHFHLIPNLNASVIWRRNLPSKPASLHVFTALVKWHHIYSETREKA